MATSLTPSRVLAALLLGCTPLVGAAFAVFVIYLWLLPNLAGVLICVPIVFPCIWVAIKIYKMVLKKGVVVFLTGASATPELDGIQEENRTQTK